MAVSGFFDRYNDRRSIRRWKRATECVRSANPEEVRVAQSNARKLQHQVTDFLAAVDERARVPFSTTDALGDALSASWAWRPSLWKTQSPQRGMSSTQSGEHFGEELKIFHDCELKEIAFRQTPNNSERDLAPFGLDLNVLGFAGSFLSLVVDLPDKALDGMTVRDLFRVEINLTSEFPISTYMRLNLKHGPNHSQMVERLDDTSEQVVEFDLGYADFDNNRLEAGWVELIIDDPSYNAVSITDFMMSRRARAEI